MTSTSKPTGNSAPEAALVASMATAIASKTAQLAKQGKLNRKPVTTVIADFIKSAALSTANAAARAFYTITDGIGLTTVYKTTIANTEALSQLKRKQIKLKTSLERANDQLSKLEARVASFVRQNEALANSNASMKKVIEKSKAAITAAQNQYNSYYFKTAGREQAKNAQIKAFEQLILNAKKTIYANKKQTNANKEIITKDNALAEVVKQDVRSLESKLSHNAVFLKKALNAVKNSVFAVRVAVVKKVLEDETLEAAGKLLK